MCKQDAVYAYTGILHCHKKEQRFDLCCDTDEQRDLSKNKPCLSSTWNQPSVFLNDTQTPCESLRGPTCRRCLLDLVSRAQHICPTPDPTPASVWKGTTPSLLLPQGLCCCSPLHLGYPSSYGLLLMSQASQTSPLHGEAFPDCPVDLVPHTHHSPSHYSIVCLLHCFPSCSSGS